MSSKRLNSTKIRTPPSKELEEDTQIWWRRRAKEEGGGGGCKSKRVSGRKIN